MVKSDRFRSIPISTPFLGVTLPLDFIPTFIFYFITFRAYNCHEAHIEQFIDEIG